MMMLASNLDGAWLTNTKELRRQECGREPGIPMRPMAPTVQTGMCPCAAYTVNSAARSCGF